MARLGLKFNPSNGSVLIPTFKRGKINNLYKAVRGHSGVRILATPTTEHTLFNWDENQHQTLWILEGHWDRIAASAIAQGEIYLLRLYLVVNVEARLD